jgi:hypothetical protein
MAPFTLLVFGITFTVIAGLFFVAAMQPLWVVQAKIRNHGVVEGVVKKADLPLGALRAGFAALIIVVNTLTQSTAWITKTVTNATKGLHIEIDSGGEVEVPAWKNNGFLAMIWIAAAFSWIALVLVVWGAFGIVRVLKRVNRLRTEEGGIADGRSEVTLVVK